MNTVDPRTGESDTWLVDLVRRTSSSFTSDPGVEWLPRWSPDGRQIAFAASRGGIPNLYVKGLAAADEGQALVTPGLDVQFPWDWIGTSAGQFILYMDRGETTGLDIMLLPLQGDRKPVPWLQTKYGEFEASVSPDRRWVAYVSTATRSREVYGRPTRGRSPLSAA